VQRSGCIEPILGCCWEIVECVGECVSKLKKMMHSVLHVHVQASLLDQTEHIVGHSLCAHAHCSCEFALFSVDFACDTKLLGSPSWLLCIVCWPHTTLMHQTEPSCCSRTTNLFSCSHLLALAVATVDGSG
jgi:hypothetical protein